MHRTSIGHTAVGSWLLPAVLSIYGTFSYSLRDFIFDDDVNGKKRSVFYLDFLVFVGSAVLDVATSSLFLIRICFCLEHSDILSIILHILAWLFGMFLRLRRIHHATISWSVQVCW